MGVVGVDGRRWAYNIKMDLKDIGCGQVAGCDEQGSEFGFRRRRIFY